MNFVNRNVKLLVVDWPSGTKINAFRILARQAALCAACRLTVAFAVRDAVAFALALARARATARACALALEFICLRAVALACARAVLDAFRDAADLFFVFLILPCGRVFAAIRVTLCACRAEVVIFAEVVVDFRVAVCFATFTTWVARRAVTLARRVECRPHAIS